MPGRERGRVPGREGGRESAKGGVPVLINAVGGWVGDCSLA